MVSSCRNTRFAALCQLTMDVTCVSFSSQSSIASFLPVNVENLRLCEILVLEGSNSLWELSQTNWLLPHVSEVNYTTSAGSSFDFYDCCTRCVFNSAIKEPSFYRMSIPLRSEAPGAGICCYLILLGHQLCCWEPACSFSPPCFYILMFSSAPWPWTWDCGIEW